MAARRVSLSWQAARIAAYNAAIDAAAYNAAVDTVACRLAVDSAAPVQATEVVPTSAALGRVLAAPLTAAIPSPNFDNAAMDGYAVRGPGPWRCVGLATAGRFAGEIADGECLRIATGAPIPRGTNAVLASEEVRVSGNRVDGDLVFGRHIRAVGENFPAGTELLPAGHRLDAVALALAASVAVDAVEVTRFVETVVLVTGDEIIGRGKPAPGQVRDAITPLLPLLTPYQVRNPEIVYCGDAELGLTSQTAQLIVVCGGTAHGPTDPLRWALGKASIIVDGVRCRPGAPQLLARLPTGQSVIGLPGNPFAALVALHTLVIPFLAGVAGMQLPALREATTESPRSGIENSRGIPPRRDEDTCLVSPSGDEDAHSKQVRGDDRTRLIPARWDDGKLVATGRDRSSSLWGAALAEALIVADPGSAPFEWSNYAVEIGDFTAEFYHSTGGGFPNGVAPAVSGKVRYLPSFGMS